ncbi:hypothetical protein [Clostridium celatum]|uniref:hypothetical protein n=1 Tax=Clostridium celatum TaxID=36834 RepID=UPI0018980C73|nr:hypothetical protein [Clostridium celatum]
MFNSKYKKEALEDLKEAGKRYDEKYKIIINDIILLHELKVDSISLIKEIEVYYSRLLNKSEEFNSIISQIKVNYEKFEYKIKQIEMKDKSIEAVAIETTFDISSNDILNKNIAIAILSGIVVGGATLGLLGSGALVAGGGGMAAGSAFLALAGPIGWAIGSSAIIGGGLLANSKNKKIAREAEEQTKKFNIATNSLVELDIKVNNFKKELVDIKDLVSYVFTDISKKDIKDYNDICKLADSGDKEGEIYKYGLMHLLNLILSLSYKINELIE